MKENDLKIEINEHPLAMFAEKEDGTYGAVETGSYMVENYIEDFWKKQLHFKNSALEKLKSAQISPIAFYMEIFNMAEADLASRVGIGAGKVKKHCTMEGFEKVKMGLLKKYADVFDITVAEFFRLDPFPPKDQAEKVIKTENEYVIVVER